jgi:DNA-binding MarR family transcriptional regulator
MATGHDIAMGLRAAYLSMHRQTNRYLAAHGMTADQFVVLALLAEEDGITQQDLVRRASSDPNTLRAMLVLLENRGCIAREQHPTDGRARRVILTPTGRRVFEKLLQAIKPVQDQLRGLFADERAEMLTLSLNHITRAMAQANGRNSQTRAETQATDGKT